MTTPRPVRRQALPVLLLLAALLLAACNSSVPASGSADAETTTDGASGQLGDLTIAAAWARPAEQGGATAVYMQLLNNGDEADALIDVAALAVTDEAMLHESKVVDNVMIMEHVHQIDIPAGETVVLEPGGLHIMLMEVKEELQVGSSLDLTLFFAQAGELTLAIPVLER